MLYHFYHYIPDIPVRARDNLPSNLHCTTALGVCEHSASKLHDYLLMYNLYFKGAHKPDNDSECLRIYLSCSDCLEGLTYSLQRCSTKDEWEKSVYSCENTTSSIHDTNIIIPVNITLDPVICFFTVVYHILEIIHYYCIQSDGLPLHAGCVMYNNRFILLAGEADGGKSTCCRMFSSKGMVHCDDEVVVLPTSSSNYKVHAFPTITSAREQKTPSYNLRKAHQLSGVFILEKSLKNEICTLNPMERTLHVYAAALQIYKRYEKKDKNMLPFHVIFEKMYENAVRIGKTVPVYKLKFSLNGGFHEQVDEVLCEL